MCSFHIAAADRCAVLCDQSRSRLGHDEMHTMVEPRCIVQLCQYYDYHEHFKSTHRLRSALIMKGCTSSYR